jgi:hypothetical protein
MVEEMAEVRVVQEMAMDWAQAAVAVVPIRVRVVMVQLAD